MKVFVKGKSEINLTKRDFVASGGEGEIYRKNRTAFKIYNNKTSCLPYNKIKELGAITSPNVIAPKELVLNSRKKPIGYTMKYISNTYALCQIFTKAFRSRNNVTPEMMLELVKQMQSTIQHIHSKKILIVDLNEMNFLVNKKLTNIYFIDADSYQTPHYPATAIMPSIRDRHTATFNQMTDWFSFGIVSFQMFIGIHPYKGKHPTIKTLDDRMLANVPVFHKDVGYPRVCQPFDVIPDAYKDWYKAIFHNGERVAPPSLSQAVVVVVPIQATIIKSNSDFDIQRVNSYDGSIVKFIFSAGTRVITTDVGSVYINGNLESNQSDSKIAITPRSTVFGCQLQFDSDEDEYGKLKILKISNNKAFPCDIQGKDIMSYGGRVYVQQSDKLSEIEFIEMGHNTLIAAHPITNIQENASKLFDGVVIQNVLGSCVASVLPESRSCHQVLIPEMKGYQVVDAKYDKNILVIIANKNGKYDKFIFKLAPDFKSYELRKIDDIAYSGINFIVLDNGVAVLINENEEIEIFANKIGKNDVKVVDSRSIKADMRLLTDGTRVLFADKNEVYRMQMKNN